jgi:hypothetical protein
MSTTVELLGGILRFFPNTILITLFVLGITTGKVAWILVAVGGLLVTILTLLIQYLFGKGLGLGPLSDRPGAAIMEACSLIPIASNATYSAIPSLWVAMSSFFVAYIFTNATNIYTQTPARINKEKIAVQQRKGVGLISMFSVVLLFVFLMVPRYWTNCETRWGVILGLLVGCGFGIGWWYILNACGADVYPDIHGVMIGLKPGALRTNPIACAPAATKK